MRSNKNAAPGEKERLAIHLPNWTAGNPYQSLLATGLAEHGWRVEFISYPKGLMPLQKLLARNDMAEVIHLHWIGPYIEDVLESSNSVYFYVKSTFLILDIFLCRMRGRRVIWTVHNRLSHETINPYREIIIRRMLSKVVSHLIFHSEGARRVFRESIAKVSESKSSIVPHGSYIGVYPVDPDTSKRLARELNITEKQKTILFFGTVRRYKGIERLLRAFEKINDPELRLVIAGKVFEKDIGQKIEDAAGRDRRITPRLCFVPQSEVGPLHSLAKLVVIPFEKTLTSGSVILAMSFGKAVVLPADAKIIDVIHDPRVFYADDRQLQEILRNLDKLDVENIGKANFEVAKQLDWMQIGSLVSEIYN